MNLAAEQIKQQISIFKVLERYGFETGRAGVMLCPFHSEDTPSFKAYPDSNGWYCYGCGQGGSVIDFVMQLFDLSFQGAIQKLDTDFGLCIFKKPTLTKYRKMKMAEQKLLEEQGKYLATIRYNQYAVQKLTDYFRWLRTQPDSPDRTHDMEYMERLLEQFLGSSEYIPINVDALIPALKTKFESEA